jgi:hypothetical protein
LEVDRDLIGGLFDEVWKAVLIEIRYADDTGTREVHRAQSLLAVLPAGDLVPC